jgi:hypothetical protein
MACHWSDSVLTFILGFDPDRAGVRAAQETLVDLGPRLAKECTGLYRHWHASRHFSLSVHNELWFRFAPSAGAAGDLTARVAALLDREGPGHGFVLNRVIEEHGAQAFGEGDPRKGHDVVKAIGGRHNLPKLWREIERATEWAIADSRSGTVRASLPDEWFDWARHIYMNLMGLE